MHNVFFTGFVLRFIVVNLRNINVTVNQAVAEFNGVVFE